MSSLSQAVSGRSRRGALSGDDRRVVIAVDVRQSLLRCEIIGVGAGLSQIVAVQNDYIPKLATVRDFHKRREAGHHHCYRNAQKPPVVRHAERVIPGRSGDRAAPLLFRREQHQRVSRAPFLKTARSLQMLELAEDFRAAQLRERD